MQDNAGKFYYADGEYVSGAREDVCLSIENRSGIRARVYEVIRIISGVPVFMEQHTDRLNASLRAFADGVSVGYAEVDKFCRDLCGLSGLSDCNIQLTYYIFDDGSVSEIHYVKKHFYPDAGMYADGVKTDLIRLDRNAPSVKNLVPEYKQKVREAMKDNFELLLVNDRGEILEGSRSNFFYVIDNEVYTCPTRLVLNGITRVNVIEAVRQKGFALRERPLRVDEITNVDGAFLSGTSINVLPIAFIGNHCLKKNGGFDRVIEDVKDQFDSILNNYILRCNGEN